MKEAAKKRLLVMSYYLNLLNSVKDGSQEALNKAILYIDGYENEIFSIDKIQPLSVLHHNSIAPNLPEEYRIYTAELLLSVGFNVNSVGYWENYHATTLDLAIDLKQEKLRLVLEEHGAQRITSFAKKHLIKTPEPGKNRLTRVSNSFHKMLNSPYMKKLFKNSGELPLKHKEYLQLSKEKKDKEAKKILHNVFRTEVKIFNFYLKGSHRNLPIDFFGLLQTTTFTYEEMYDLLVKRKELATLVNRPIKVYKLLNLYFNKTEYIGHPYLFEYLDNEAWLRMLGEGKLADEIFGTSLKMHRAWEKAPGNISDPLFYIALISPDLKTFTDFFNRGYQTNWYQLFPAVMMHNRNHIEKRNYLIDYCRSIAYKLPLTEKLLHRDEIPIFFGKVGKAYLALLDQNRSNALNLIDNIDFFVQTVGFESAMARALAYYDMCYVNILIDYRILNGLSLDYTHKAVKALEITDEHIQYLEFLYCLKKTPEKQSILIDQLIEKIGIKLTLSIALIYHEKCTIQLLLDHIKSKRTLKNITESTKKHIEKKLFDKKTAEKLGLHDRESIYVSNLFRNKSHDYNFPGNLKNYIVKLDEEYSISLFKIYQPNLSEPENWFFDLFENTDTDKKANVLLEMLRFIKESGRYPTALSKGRQEKVISELLRESNTKKETPLALVRACPI